MSNESVTAAFQQGLALHQQGRLDEAEALYRSVLATEAAHFGALHLTGLIHFQRGQPAAAVEWIERAIAVNPGVAGRPFQSRSCAATDEADRCGIGELRARLAAQARQSRKRSTTAAMPCRTCSACRRRSRATTAPCRPGPTSRRRTTIAAMRCVASTGRSRRWRATTAPCSSGRTIPTRSTIAAAFCATSSASTRPSPPSRVFWRCRLIAPMARGCCSTRG